MSERNEKMAAMLAADAPAAHDMAFQVAVMAKIEQRRYQRGLAVNLVLTAALTCLLALVMPGLEPVLRETASGMGLVPVAAMLIIASMALPWWLTRRA